MTPIITRFAPSPTGNLHIGSARTALINFIISKQNPLSKFYIRIEDTDKKRSRVKFTENIIEGLEWLGINWENEIQKFQDNPIEQTQSAIKYNPEICPCCGDVKDEYLEALREEDE